MCQLMLDGSFRTPHGVIQNMSVMFDGTLRAPHGVIQNMSVSPPDLLAETLHASCIHSTLLMIHLHILCYLPVMSIFATTDIVSVVVTLWAHSIPTKLFYNTWMVSPHLIHYQFSMHRVKVHLKKGMINQSIVKIKILMFGDTVFLL